MTFHKIKNIISIPLSIAGSILFVAVVAYGATSIGTSISTSGNLTVSGIVEFLSNLTIGGNATTTGNFNVSGETTLATTTLSGYLDLGLKQLKSAVLEKLSIWPSSPTQGQMFYSTASSTPYWYTGSEWKGDVSGATFVVAASDSVNKEKADYVCDGTADDVQIQAAIDALPTGGGKVLLMEGTYAISTSVTLSASSTLQGISGGTRLTLGNNLDINMINVENNTTISNLSIDMNKANNSSGSGVSINRDTNVLVENCYIENAPYYGILMWDAVRVKIINNTLSENWRGLDLDESSGSGIGSTDVEIIGNQITATNLTHIKIEHSTGIRVIGNSFIQDGTAASVVVDEGGDGTPVTKDVIITDNMFSEGFLSLIDAPNGSFIITENTFQDSYFSIGDIETVIFHNNSMHNPVGNYAIYPNSTTGFVSVVGNHIVAGADSTRDGIVLGGTATWICDQNFVSGFLRYGIRLANNNCKVRYNVVQGDNDGGTGLDEAIFFDDRTGGEVIGNECYNATRGIETDDSTEVIIRDNYMRSCGTGIRENGTSANIIENNRFSDIAGANELIPNANSTVRWNTDYITENSGTTTITSGNTNVNVTHNLGAQPATSTISIIPLEHLGNASTTNFWISDVGASTFRINVGTDPGKDVDFSWQVGSY